jgi:hypothetical protein
MRNAPIRCHAGAAPTRSVFCLLRSPGALRTPRPPGRPAQARPRVRRRSRQRRQPPSRPPRPRRPRAVKPSPSAPATAAPPWKCPSRSPPALGRQPDGPVAARSPEANWVAEQKERHALIPPADNSERLKGDQGKGHPYGNYTERDVLTWARETEKFVAEGSRIFHSAGRARQHGRRLLRHVPSARGQHAPGNVSQVPDPVGPRRPAPRHDRLVH